LEAKAQAPTNRHLLFLLPRGRSRRAVCVKPSCSFCSVKAPAPALGAGGEESERDREGKAARSQAAAAGWCAADAPIARGDVARSAPAQEGAVASRLRPPPAGRQAVVPSNPAFTQPNG